MQTMDLVKNGMLNLLDVADPGEVILETAVEILPTVLIIAAAVLISLFLIRRFFKKK